jgi:hypothetical protein
MPGNIKQMFDSSKLSDLIKFLEEEINKNSGIFITKDTGFFQSKKIERRKLNDK